VLFCLTSLILVVLFLPLVAVLRSSSELVTNFFASLCCFGHGWLSGACVK
jgi:hypothetical protein